MAAPSPACHVEIPVRDLSSETLLDIIGRVFHHRTSEWIFLRELRVGTGHSHSFAQRLDGFALNCLPHLSMRRICYEVKVSRADFLGELKQPLKRRIGMRYSNEFYFVAPRGLLAAAEIPIDCGLVEVCTFEKMAELSYFDGETGMQCTVAVPAPWRDTPPPTWQFTAAMLRNQRREMEGKPPAPPKQGRLELR
ncbi:MAG: hypothetical protein JO108_28655 [Acidobacteriaceae bacterium]|nr:hypothetical protein [Acidobacteriaceae bacterium]